MLKMSFISLNFLMKLVRFPSLQAQNLTSSVVLTLSHHQDFITHTKRLKKVISLNKTGNYLNSLTPNTTRIVLGLTTATSL